MRQSLHDAFLLLCLIYFTNGYNRIVDLNGKWSFKSYNGTFQGTGYVPGDIFSDLYHEGLIDNPLYGDNHLKLGWVANEDWIYTREFIMDHELNHTTISLDVSGLDTISIVHINDVQVLDTTNQFVSYHVKINNLVKVGMNNITVKFKSPTIYARVQSDEFKAMNGHELPPVCPPQLYHGDCHQNFLRKAQYSFSWDWGPSFPTMGISKDISISIIKNIHFHDFAFTNKLVDGAWRIDVFTTTFHVGASQVEYVVEIPKLNYRNSDVFLLSVNRHFKTKSVNRVSLNIPDEELERWWPNGMGEQKRYTIKVSLGHQVKTKLISFRTVELVQTLIDAKKKDMGRNFYFKINDVPIFLKGSNWIPVSMFPSNKTNIPKMKFLLDSAVAVGMNVLRVWGGGFYETDEFYDYASEKGILIWQDLMFACALYPNIPNFVASVKLEVSQQVERLSDYPSILVYAGNNENEAAIRGHWWHVSNYTEEQQVEDYVALYSELGKVVKEAEPDIPFVMSSPSNGVESEKEGGVAKNPYDVKYGDIHFYNEFVNLWRDDSYLTPRCASEYGVQSYPLRETMVKWIDPSEWAYTSDSMYHRQHHPGATATNLMMIFSHLPIPNECESKSLSDIHRCEFVSSDKFMSRFSYFSQIHQAVALKTQTLHYRRFRNVTNEVGIGNTMCAMYWQLNDVWAAPTWSTIDFEQKWKMAHYEARRFFANVAVFSFPDEIDFNLEVYVVNDNTSPLENVKVTIEMLRWDNGMDPIMSSEFNIDQIPAATSEHVNIGLEISSTAELKDYLYVTHIYDKNDTEIAKDVFIPDYLFEVNFSTFGNVKIENIKRKKDTEYEITISTDLISPFTWIDCKKDFLGWFSDNGFHMVDRVKVVTLHLKEKLDLTIYDFTVCNLKNCYI